MGLFSWFKKNKKVEEIKKTKVKNKRNFEGGKANDFLTDWVTVNERVDYQINAYYKTLRERARHLANNDDYIKRYLNILKFKILGEKGIVLQAKYKNQNLNKKIEEQFKIWTNKKYCCVDGKMDFIEVQHFALEQLARDGECFIRIVHNPELRFGFALEILDNDRIDFDYNKDLGNGKKIKNGIQFDEWGKPIKYFLIKNKDDYMGVNHLQVSAKDIIHLFIPYLPNQSRGITWLHSNIITMRHLSALTEAELIASRIAAAKMGVIKTQSGTEFKGDFEDEDGAQISELTPGTMFQLPVGTETQLLDPTHPNGNYAEFAKILLKKAASGLNVPYSSLTSDLREANYSSLRAGELDARDYYTIIQNYLKNHLMDDVLNIWLNKNNELQNVKLLNVKDIFSFKYEWQARRWPWVDPLKDVKAQIESNTSRLKTKKQIISEMGYDYQDMIEEFKNEIEIEKEIFSSVNNIEQEIDNNEDQSNNEEITNGTNEQELSAQSEPVEN